MIRKQAMLKLTTFTIAQSLAANPVLPAGLQAVSQFLQSPIKQSEHRFQHTVYDRLKETPHYKPDPSWESGRAGQVTCD